MKRTKSEKCFSVFNIILLTGISIITLYPLLYVLFASISDPALYLKHTGPLLKPEGFSLLAYQKVLAKPEILSGYANTIFYVVVGTAISMAITISFAYVLSRKDLFFGRPMMIMVIITMYFHGGLIPTYLLVQGLGIVNTRLAVILPTAVNTFNLIIMRTAFAGVPPSLEEAAKIDGASPLKILVRIMIPLAMPSIAVITLYYAVAQWNSWFQAAIYLRDQNLYPLQLFLREILIINKQTDMLGGTSGDMQLALGETIKHATIVVSVIPILCVYPFLQKYFTKGVMVGAVKG